MLQQQRQTQLQMEQHQRYITSLLAEQHQHEQAQGLGLPPTTAPPHMPCAGAQPPAAAPRAQQFEHVQIGQGSQHEAAPLWESPGCVPSGLAWEHLPDPLYSVPVAHISPEADAIEWAVGSGGFGAPCSQAPAAYSLDDEADHLIGSLQTSLQDADTQFRALPVPDSSGVRGGSVQFGSVDAARGDPGAGLVPSPHVQLPDDFLLHDGAFAELDSDAVFLGLFDSELDGLEFPVKAEAHSAGHSGEGAQSVNEMAKRQSAGAQPHTEADTRGFNGAQLWDQIEAPPWQPPTKGVQVPAAGPGPASRAGDGHGDWWG